MRRLLWLPLFALSVGCGQKVDHPAGAPDCDPATMNCATYNPPRSGSTGGGVEGSGGDSGGGDAEGATISGLVVTYADDFFDGGLAFSGEAEVSAMGVSGARVETTYEGNPFELRDVLKDGGNWFMVEPGTGQGMLTTITPVDTRVVRSQGYAIGLASDILIDNLFVLLGAERQPARAQLVVTVVDEQGRSVAGVEAQVTAEIVAYRQAGGWSESDVGTDDSGMIFLGNVQAPAALSNLRLTLSGTANAQVEVQTKSGAVTVVAVVVD